MENTEGVVTGFGPRTVRKEKMSFSGLRYILLKNVYV